MPHTTAKAASIIRAGFTGEVPATALPGIDRSGGLGLDHCTPEQTELRALLALACFNHGTLTAPRLRWRVGQIGAYDPVISPRFDHLVLIVNACDNIALRLVGSSTDPHIPGMRVEERLGYYLWSLRHLPSGAQMYVSERNTLSAGRGPARCLPNLRRRLGVEEPLTADDYNKLAAVPEISPSMKRLLAGIWVRMSLRDPNGSFDLGGWCINPLDRTTERARWAPTSRLWGHEGRWDLEWRVYPFPDDLIAALTHPIAGIEGVMVDRMSTHSWLIRLDDAELYLHDEEL
ncbi:MULTISPECIES: hypothetical protein [unclassified Streptomyces]|uniref:hypothetical protein n=1 Tax=unclassified Streptomyces TaxID=2593676 RepID=UPI0006C23FEB|nr:MULTISPECIES: hypothetical protein [unclassified Streptomyces]KOX18543.1 hypothetical protein ADL06_30630 [Streptomyces sp. NRRL F-6491]KOX37600.1 hypothetical protein ADL08_29575 [Streptomyces sp. NRRL F-6492]